MKKVKLFALAAAALLCACGADTEKKLMDENKKLETATLAGGCFWGMEEILRELPGVEDPVVGYCGGKTENPVYEQVKTGTTGHAETIQFRFDPAKISYAAILDMFFKMHDPTTPNRQGNDAGTQYRSVIFYHDEGQRLEAGAAVKRAQDGGRWRRPITTEVVPAGKFWPAEEYHQDYLKKNPGGYTCHYVRD
ncbi:MAG TPA: peptide-methionine (S)-S-oxide reductase [Elusimicrobia bacterium]|nr:peptide-methionine (S)-S-oxide reductase [Elusimicrobiota bacterium]HAU90326.1 peptide-methionine (S)-S-oxide reductase [Elusimicrobiota bacterium]